MSVRDDGRNAMEARRTEGGISRRGFSKGLLGGGLLATVPGLLAACASSPDSGTKAKGGAGGSKDSLLVAYATDPAELDPALAFNPQSQEIIQNCYKSLIDFGTQSGPGGMAREDVGIIKPVLAEKYTVSPDGKTYTFNLRRGIRSQAGHELTTDDVSWSFDWMFNSGGRRHLPAQHRRGLSASRQGHQGPRQIHLPAPGHRADTGHARGDADLDREHR